jgi:hypothetical protein
MFQDGRVEVELQATGNVLVALQHADALAAGTVPSRRIGPWPLLRRLLTEGRDRLAPAMR